MPISYIYNGEPMNGTAQDDFFIAYKGSTGTDNNTILGNGGDDLVVGDSSDTWIPSSSYMNGSIANAFNLETLTSTWTTAENPMFGDWTIPHTTAIVEATIGQSEYFRVAIGAGQKITVDIDFGDNTPIGVSRDLVAELQDNLGNILVTDDDSLVSDGGLGSFPSVVGSASTHDPYLTFTAPTAGIYYINIRPSAGGPGSTFTDNATFLMNISLTGHATAAANPVQGADSIDGGAGDDALFGGGGGDTINGGIGDDLIDGGSGGDIIHGGDGNDVVYGGDGTEENAHGDDGNDVLYSGGEGHYYGDAGDDLIYAGLTAGVNEILDGGTGIDTIDTTTWNGTYVVDLVTGTTNFGESFINFENVVTGNGADTITGTAGSNRIETNGGNDTLDGGGGSDILDGGAGIDTASFASYSGAVTIDLQLVGVSQVGGSKLYGIENLTGTAFDDNLTGDAGANVLSGGAGSDVLIGGAGADSLSGGDGIDYLMVDGADTAITGGTGFDSAFVQTAAAVTLNMGTASIEWAQGNSGADTFNAASQTSAVYLYGMGGNDTLTGSALGDYLDGGDGTDTLAGGGGADLLLGNGGSDILLGQGGDDSLIELGGDSQIDGGTGFDSLFVWSDTGVALNLTTASIEWVQGSVLGDDNLNGAGNTVNTFLYGWGGNDTLRGGSGDDYIAGGAGNDVLTGGAGNDTMIGEAGVDRYIYTAAIWGSDTIHSFDANGEKLDFTAVGAIDSFSDFTAFEWDPGSLGYNSTTLFYTSGGTTSSITLIGVQTASLSDADFLFA